ncbi:regucalcin-like isoform X2 [Galleria mellonella]|uniref:Regucalcin-like isoform X2 n=1 Tax=Galleria mellonella TaxID=7137 RepID=A0ABM3MRM9_GALME|nr:regucalcin-like isoform X2 [Galleria mellonella]
MLNFLFLLFTVSKISVAIAEDSKHYKISMVSSNDNPDKPAIFNHAESPVWDPRSQSLYFVDVHLQNVHRLDYTSGKIYTKHIVSGSRRLLVAVRSALYLLDWDVEGDNALRLITTLDEGLPDNVINEGKPDAEGRFWVGTKGYQIFEDVLNDKATLYSIDQNNFRNPVIHLRPISISNGLVWALNNSVMYYIDSPTMKIEAFDFDIQKGEISGRRTIIDISNYGYEDAIPDGMTIDDGGHLWVAIMFGGTVLHIDPDAKLIIHSYKLPTSRVTSVAWGGPNLDELFITTAQDKVKINAEPLEGAIFTIRDTGRRGVSPNYFQFDKANTY